MKSAMVFPDIKSEKGISNYSIKLVENMRKQGFSIDEITFTQGKPLSLFKNCFKLLKYDVLHIQHEYNLLGWYGLPFFFLLIFLKLFGKAKIVLTMHTVLSKKEKFKHGKIKTFLRKLLYFTQNKLINKTCKKVVVHADFFKKILEKEYGFNKNKIEVFPHAIIENIKTISKEEAKKELKLSGKVYLIIGVMGPAHGHDRILKRADKIGKTILVVSNPNPVNDRNVKRIRNWLDYNKQIVEKNHFNKFVRFDMGFVPYDKWWKYFSAADLILLPYRGGIGSGIFADAMAMKKPVIASNVPYFKEISNNYGCLKLAKKDSDFPKIIKESIKKNNYSKMIKECKKYFDENGLTPISKKYIKFYKNILN